MDPCSQCSPSPRRSVKRRVSADVHFHSYCRFYRKWRALPASGRGAAGATAVVESLRQLPQLTELKVNLQENELGPGLAGFVKASWTPKPRPRQGGGEEAPGHLRRAAGASEKPRALIRGPAGARPGAWSWLGLFGCEASASARWWWPFSRALRICRQKSRGRAVVESEHSDLSPHSIAVLLWCWSWVFAGLGPLRTGVRIRR